MAIYILIVNLYVHLMVDENREQIRQQNKESFEEPLTLRELVLSLKGFFTNKNLTKYMTILIFWRVGFSPVECSSDTILL